jgi:hypothetical protein
VRNLTKEYCTNKGSLKKSSVVINDAFFYLCADSPRSPAALVLNVKMKPRVQSEIFPTRCKARLPLVRRLLSILFEPGLPSTVQMFVRQDGPVCNHLCKFVVGVVRIGHLDSGLPNPLYDTFYLHTLDFQITSCRYNKRFEALPEPMTPTTK